MKYLCTKCNYIYDEMMGEKEDGIDYGILFEKLNHDFSCPQCNESSEYFQEVTQHIHSLDDQALVGIEAEHIPFIEKLEDGYIKIELNHPDEEDHFVGNIGIYDEYSDLVHQEFISPGSPAYLEYDVSDLDEYEIRVQCSIHGVFAKKFTN